MNIKQSIPFTQEYCEKFNQDVEVISRLSAVGFTVYVAVELLIIGVCVRVAIWAAGPRMQAWAMPFFYLLVGICLVLVAFRWYQAKQEQNR